MFKHVLVPLDGSGFAELAIPYAVDLAHKSGGKITLIRVISPPQPTSADLAPDASKLMWQLRTMADKEAQDYLQALTDSLNKQGHTADWDITGDPSPADSILTMATEKGVDAIVMSTHGRSGLGRFVFGSVAEKVVRHSDVPVLLIRAKETAS
ncbi:MAG: universal stress protein [Chloroflexi bacterium]|nr:universal stress protein [Chloroflexota bacterium]